MKASEYQAMARSTAIYCETDEEIDERTHGWNEQMLRNELKRKNEQMRMAYVLLGAAGEIGEMCNKFKKVLRGDYSLDTIREDLLKEAGDYSWYLANTVCELGGNLDDVFRENIDKLQSRKERGVLQGSGDNR